jgi:DNA replication protein DnaC
LPQAPKIYECSICSDTEFIYDKPTNTSERCSCWKAKQYKQLYESSGIAQALAEKTLKNFITTGKPALVLKAKATVQEFINNFEKVTGLAFLGQVGCGKSHLCIALANVLLSKNIGVLYMQYREAITHLKQNMTDEEFYQRELGRYKSAPVLYIDDLYKGALRQGKINESDISILFEIINYRYLNRKPLIISSEYMIDSLLEFDEAVGSRILEMCRGYIIEFEGQNLNYRIHS